MYGFTLDHAFICEAPDEEMQQLGCQCEPAEEDEHFVCDCWATQYSEPSRAHTYLDCMDALNSGQTKSGLYLIKPNSLKPFQVKKKVLLVTLFSQLHIEKSKLVL